MNIEDLRRENLILFECISGSKAFGLDTPESDTDIRGVFILPKEKFYGFSGPDQVANDTNDIVFFELKKFMGLLSRNNPNILEMLYTPDDCLIYEHPLFAEIRRNNFLSKLCRNTFVKYAMSQIKKARGLNKKMVNPMPLERRSILEFCHVTVNEGSQPLTTWIKEQGIDQWDCGLKPVPCFPDTFELFHAQDQSLRGLTNQNPEANDLRTSKIPEGLNRQCYLHFNRDGFLSHCKQFSAYESWKIKRNEIRYQTNISHGKNYDSKNMMHVFRMLATARDIACHHRIDLRAYDRDFLLRVKAGVIDYDRLISMAEAQTRDLDQFFEHSRLPDHPDEHHIETLLIKTRSRFYQMMESS